MTSKKLSTQVLPQASPSSMDESPTAQETVLPKQSASAVQKSVAKERKAPRASAQPATSTLQAPSDKTAKKVAAKTQSRSPALTPKRKPTRLKKSALPTPHDQPIQVEPMDTGHLLAPEVPTSQPATHTENTVSEKPAPVGATPPELTVAELWEQDSPIRNRIAQLRSRNSLLEEQLQRLRPPVQVRGKKK